MKNNQNHKRVISLLIAAILIITSVVGGTMLASAASGPAGTISSETGISAQAGSTVTVPINISGNQGIMGMGLIVSYDKDVLTPVSVAATELTSGGTYDDSIETSTDSSFKIIWADSDELTANGTLFNVTFRVSEYAEGNTDVTFDYSAKDTFNENFEKVELVCGSASISISHPAATETTIRGQANLTVDDGNEIDVPILIEKASSQNLAFEMTYNEEAFDYVSYNAGMAPSSGISIEQTDGKLAFSLSDIDTSSESGILLTVKMRAAEYAGGMFMFGLASQDVATQEFRIKVNNTHSGDNAVVYGEGILLDNNQLKVPVMINNNHGIAGFRMTVSYDKNVLTPVSITKDSKLAGSFNHSMGETQGVFDVLWTGTENMTSNGVLFTVVFSIDDSEASETEIGLDYTQGDTCDENADDVFLTMRNITATLIPEPDEPKLDSITVSKAKTIYQIGETLNVDDIVVTATYEDGSSIEVEGWESDADEIDMNSIGRKTLTISYTDDGITKTKEIILTVRAILDSIEVSKTKTKYSIGEELDISDITVTASYIGQESREVTNYSTNAESIDISTEGEKTLIVSYTENGKTVTSSIVIEVKRKLVEIRIMSCKTDYNVGDEIIDRAYSSSDVDAPLVYAVWSHGIMTTIPYIYGGFGYTTNKDSIDMSTEGDKELVFTFTYDGVTTTAEVMLHVTQPYIPEEPVLSTISADKTKRDYHVGDEISLDDLIVTATYSDGSTKQVDDYTTTVGDIDMSTAGSKVLTVSYTEDNKTVTAVVQINVTAVLTTISATKTKTTYNYGETINYDDVVVTAEYSDGTTREVSGWTTNADEIDMSQVGEKTLTISFEYDDVTKTVDIPILVEAVVDYITVTKEKTDYEVGDTLSIKDITVTAYYNDGTSKEVSGFAVYTDAINMDVPGVQTIVISYVENGKKVTSSVKITVNEPAPPEFLYAKVEKTKTVYNQDEKISVDDISVKFIFSDGSEEIVTDYSTNVDEINTSKPGEYSLYVTNLDSTELYGVVKITINQKDTEKPSLPIYRLYNPKTKEHLWTASKKEYNVLPGYGWKQEGTAWHAPKEGQGVYRLYNPKTKDHHYTSSANEAKVLTTSYGWVYDNNKKPVFYSGGKVPIYRLYNKKFTVGSHHLTKSVKEYNVLPDYGWKQEGIALKCVK